MVGALDWRRIIFLLQPACTCKWKLMFSLCEVDNLHVVITVKESLGLKSKIRD